MKYAAAWRRGGGCLSFAILLVELLLVHEAFAQQSLDFAARCAGEKTTAWLSNKSITSKENLDLIRNCTHIEGSLYVSIANTTIVDLGRIQQISGQLGFSRNYYHDSVSEIIATELSEVGGHFEISDFSSLRSVRMPKLASVGKQYATKNQPQFKIVDNQNLTSLEFSANGIDLYMGDGYYQRYPEVKISNTSLAKLDFLNLAYTPLLSVDSYRSDDYLSSVLIQGNQNMTEINLPKWNGTWRYFTILENGPNLSVSFDDLTAVQDLKINHAATITAPNLVNITGSLEIGNNSLSVLDFPSLVRIGGNCTISNNTQMTSIRMNALQDVGLVRPRSSYSPLKGDLRVEENPSLLNIDGFKNISAVEKGIWITGNFSNLTTTLVDTVRETTHVHVTSYNPEFNCSALDNRVAQIWPESTFPTEANYTCITFSAEGTDISPPPPPIIRRSRFSKGVMAGIVVGSVAGAALFASMIWLVVKKRKEYEK